MFGCLEGDGGRVEKSRGKKRRVEGRRIVTRKVRGNSFPPP